jgi:hypothetical protein
MLTMNRMILVGDLTRPRKCCGLSGWALLGVWSIDYCTSVNHMSGHMVGHLSSIIDHRAFSRIVARVILQFLPDTFTQWACSGMYYSLSNHSFWFRHSSRGVALSLRFNIQWTRDVGPRILPSDHWDFHLYKV